ncbi:MipA/OmpV family protein [Cellvibrio mixtus]|uniref:MipA/OmpV family protein n=1 Tax=Cellvibrio mixtus TaxID=39650 RepID=UPI0005865523|nr:MipA/OmpV family protein [Cellvibrio mixtus]
MNHFFKSIAFGAAALFAVTSYACEQGEKDCVEVGTWDISVGIGIGVRTNPVDDGDDIPLVLIPQINYNGEHFFIQNLDLGVIVWENETQQLNLMITPSYDQVFFDRWNPSNFFTESNTLVSAGVNGGKKNDYSGFAPEIEGGTELVSPGFKDVNQRDLRNRRTAGLGGIEYQFSTALADFQFQYLSEFTGLYHGDEARLSVAKHWVSGKHHVIGSLGAVWQSEEVVNYYYGVTPPEADSRGTYVADAAISGIARIDWNYELTERWDLRFLASYRQLPDEISASPLINDNKVITVFFGGVYHF